MTGGSLTYTSVNGPLFYVTNSTGVVTLTGVNITAASGTLIKASTGNWGQTGSNGGTAIITAAGQAMAGNIVIDSSSSVTATLKEKSSLTGHINNGNTAKSVNLTLDSSSSWNVTADSYLTGLSDADGISGLSVTNITGNSHNVHYDASLAANSYLGGKTCSLANGGELLPSGSGSCSYTVTPSATSFVYGGGSGSITVEASDLCSWTAKSDSSWLSITAGSFGSGSGKVSFTVAANSATSARTATISVAGGGRSGVGGLIRLVVSHGFLKAHLAVAVGVCLIKVFDDFGDQRGTFAVG